MGPTHAELARTLLRGRLPGLLYVEGSMEPLPLRHATDCTGAPLALARDGDRLALALQRRDRGGSPLAVLRVEDVPPLDGAPSLGRARILGRLIRIEDADVPHAVLEFADSNPIEDLFDVGTAATLYRIEPDRVHLEHRQRGGGLLEMDEYIAADPDPLHDVERELLVDLADHHAAQVAPHFRRLLAEAGLACRAPRAVRLDRYGFVVDTGCPAADPRDRWVRLNFPRQVRDRDDLAHLLHPLLFHCGQQAA
jgi:hypothetical protein